jgi:hypothetical protein
MTPGQLNVVITAYNYYPYETTIPVNASGGPPQAANPDPPDGATGVPTTSSLSWDPSENAASYMVYFGTSNPPGYKATVTSPAYTPGGMTYETAYYWRVDAYADNGSFSVGAVWSFTTADWPYSPSQVAGPSPPDGADNVSIEPLVLSWDNAHGAVSYEIYFGDSPDPEYRGTTTATAWDPGSVEFLTRYYWRVDAKNSQGACRGPAWRFTTQAEPGDERDPWDNYAINGSLLEPTGSIRTHGPHTLKGSDVVDWFRVRLEAGKAYTFETVPEDVDTVGTLYADPNRYKLVAYDDDGGSDLQFKIIYVSDKTQYYYLAAESYNPDGNASYTLGYYVSGESEPPGAVTWGDPYPGEADVPINYGALTWETIQGASRYDVYFGTSPVPPFVGCMNTSTWELPTLDYETTYYWRINSKNYSGATEGPLWSFSTTAYIAADIYDPADDTWEGATSIIPAKTAATHSPHAFNVCDNRDWFGIEMVAGRIYYFESLGDGDTVGYLYADAAGGEYVAHDDDSGEDCMFALSYMALENATYYLLVEPYDLYSTETYELSFFYTDDEVQPGKVGYGSPYDGEINVPTVITLSWDVAANASEYALYFGTETPPPLLNASVRSIGLAAPVLEEKTSYYWRVDAKNYYGTTTGDEWSFRTGDAPALDEWDPGDDSPGSATLIEPSAETASHGPHTLNSLDNADFFRVHMVRGCTCTFDSIGGTGDTYAYIFATRPARRTSPTTTTAT